MRDPIVALTKNDMIAAMQHWLDAEFKKPMKVADVIFDTSTSRFKVYVSDGVAPVPTDGGQR